MSNLRVVHRHVNKSRTKEIAKGLIAALFLALAVGVGLVALVESVKALIK